MNNHKIEKKIILFIIIIGLLIIPYNFQPINAWITPKSANIDSTAIKIDGNVDFINQVIDFNWSGEGSKNSPFLIKDLSLSIQNGTGISIQNTNLYFILQNITVVGDLTNESAGFKFNNVSNGILYQNKAINHTLNGYSFCICSNFNVTSNYARQNGNGFIFSYYSENNFISENIACDNQKVGISIGSSRVQDDVCMETSSDEHSQKQNLIKNTVFNNSYGIVIGFCSSYNFISNNLVYDNNIGIYSYINSYSNTILNNMIFQNHKDGITLWSGSSSNNYVNNSISENGQNGIRLNYQCDRNIFAYNSFVNNSEFALYDFTNEDDLEEWKEDRDFDKNIIQNNNFLSNNQGGVQVYINNTNYRFNHNYWSDHHSPDKNRNQIVDDPYIIAGDVHLEDETSLTDLNVYHGEEIIYPSTSISAGIWGWFPIIGTLMMILLLTRKKIDINRKVK